MKSVQKLVRQEIVSSRDYARLMRETPSVIRSSRFLPPQIGQRGDFGSFWVKYAFPQKRYFPNAIKAFLPASGFDLIRGERGAMSESGDGVLRADENQAY